MSSKSYFKVTGVIFSIVAIAHLLRALKGWNLTIHTFDVPTWASWAGFAVAGFLAYQALGKK